MLKDIPMTVDAVARDQIAPVTPLPWGNGGVFYEDNRPVATTVWGPTPPGKQSGEWIVKRCLLKDGEYIVHAANNYPRLISMIRLLLAHEVIDVDDAAEALLRELGEAWPEEDV